MSHIRKVGELCRALVVSLLRRALKATGGGNGSALRDEKTAAQSTPEFAPSLSRYPAIILQSAEVGIAKSDSKSAAYENRTKSAQSGGLETNGPREGISGLTGSTQCGGFRAKPAVISDFSATNLGGESWSQKDWRSRRNWQLTLSEFVAIFLLGETHRNTTTTLIIDQKIERGQHPGLWQDGQPSCNEAPARRGPATGDKANEIGCARISMTARNKPLHRV